MIKNVNDNHMANQSVRALPIQQNVKWQQKNPNYYFTLCGLRFWIYRFECKIFSTFNLLMMYSIISE